MANSPAKSYGISSGLLRTMSNIGMVCSFAVALLVASITIPRKVAFEIFLGTGFNLSSSLATSFVDGMHAALLTSVGLLVVAFALSILRGKEARTAGHEEKPGR